MTDTLGTWRPAKGSEWLTSFGKSEVEFIADPKDDTKVIGYLNVNSRSVKVSCVAYHKAISKRTKTKPIAAALTVKPNKRAAIVWVQRMANRAALGNSESNN